MKRIMLTVAYDGTAYHGWQLQKNGISVEEVLNNALSAILGEEIRVHGVSRTDAGVHAKGNLCIFDTETRIPPEKIAFAVTGSLPEDVSVMESREVPDGFHPRKWNSEKTYQYRIVRCVHPDPIRRRYSWFCYYDLDAVRMQRAADYLTGEHDFTSFCSADTEAESHIRTILSLSVEEKEEEILLTVTGNGFLYNMVRIIAGTLIEVGRGNIRPESIPAILEARDRNAAGPTAPARGLCLMKIRLIDPPWERGEGKN